MNHEMHKIREKSGMNKLFQSGWELLLISLKDIVNGY